MRAGLLTEKISIYRADIIQGEDGATNDIHTFITSTKAQVVSKAGDRTVVNDEVIYPFRVTFTVWRYIDIKEYTDNIMWNNNKYRVLSVSDDKANNRKIIETEKINE